MKTYRTSCLDCDPNAYPAECPECGGSGMADYYLYELVEHAVARVGYDHDDVVAAVIQSAPEADTYDIQEALNEFIDADDAARKEIARLHPWGL